MDIDWVRRHCMSLPNTTETIQWGNDLVFKIGGKMYAVIAVEPGTHWMSLKCSAEKFAELTERPGITPAPYLARAQWVALENATVMSRAEVKALLRSAYEIVLSKLPKTARLALSGLVF